MGIMVNLNKINFVYKFFVVNIRNKKIRPSYHKYTIKSVFVSSIKIFIPETLILGTLLLGTLFL